MAKKKERKKIKMENLFKNVIFIMYFECNLFSWCKAHFGILNPEKKCHSFHKNIKYFVLIQAYMRHCIITPS